MESPSTVKGIGETRHSIAEYIRIPLLLPGKSDIGEPVLAEIIVDVHLVDDLRANMLIGMDTMGPEGIDIITTKRHAYVTSCNTRIPVDIKPRGARVRRAVKATNDVLVKPGEQVTIPVNYHAQLPERDLLFELDQSELTLYAHVVDSSVDSILARNESSTPVSVTKKTRLGYITELPYDNCYLATPEVAELAAKPPKKTRQYGWTRQVLKAATAVTGRKYGQQYAGPFKILDRVGRLVYRLDIPKHWRIYNVFTVAQLEPVPAAAADPFGRERPAHPPSVFVEGDTDKWKSYYVERLLNKRMVRKGGRMVAQYLVR